MKPGYWSPKVDKEEAVLLLPYGTLEVDLLAVERIQLLSYEVPFLQYSSFHLAIVIVRPSALCLSGWPLHIGLPHLLLCGCQHVHNAL